MCNPIPIVRSGWILRHALSGCEIDFPYPSDAISLFAAINELYALFISPAAMLFWAANRAACAGVFENCFEALRAQLMLDCILPICALPDDNELLPYNELRISLAIFDIGFGTPLMICGDPPGASLGVPNILFFTASAIGFALPCCGNIRCIFVIFTSPLFFRYIHDGIGIGLGWTMVFICSLRGCLKIQINSTIG